MGVTVLSVWGTYFSFKTNDKSGFWWRKVMDCTWSFVFFLLFAPRLYSVLWEVDPMNSLHGSLILGIKMWMVSPTRRLWWEGGRKMRQGIYSSGSVHSRTAVCCCFALLNITSAVEWLSPTNSGKYSCLQAKCQRLLTMASSCTFNQIFLVSFNLVLLL